LIGSTGIRTCFLLIELVWATFGLDFCLRPLKILIDQSLIVLISSVDSAQEAALRSLHREQHYSKKQIHYTYQNEATIMQVESVLPESIKGKTTFVLTLKPCPQGQGNNMIEVNFNGYSADKISELRDRFLLLDKLLPPNQNIDCYIINYVNNGYDNSVKVEKCFFINLWRSLKNNDPQLFLTHGRLTAIRYLKMSCIVEPILGLKFTLLKNNILSVKFRGQKSKLTVIKNLLLLR
jgi:hypothetical protein